MSFTLEEMYEDPEEVEEVVVERWRRPFDYVSEDDVIDLDILDEDRPDTKVVCVDVDGMAKYMIRHQDGSLQDLEEYMNKGITELVRLNNKISKGPQGSHLGGIRG